MVLGIISDVHANVVALDAVLEALRAQGATTIVCLGDLVGYGPSPNETIERIREEGVLCTLGASDERIAFHFAKSFRPRKGVGDTTLEWTKSVLDQDHVAWLREVPVQRRIDTPAGRLRAFHGSAHDPNGRTNLHIGPVELMRLLDEHRCSILTVGGTHVPYLREFRGQVAVNPGSVGLSLNGEPGADYALVSIYDGKVEVKMDKVEYDVASVAFDIVAWGLPAVVAEAIQQGRMPHTVGDVD